MYSYSSTSIIYMNLDVEKKNNTQHYRKKVGNNSGNFFSFLPIPARSSIPL